MHQFSDIATVPLCHQSDLLAALQVSWAQQRWMVNSEVALEHGAASWSRIEPDDVAALVDKFRRCFNPKRMRNFLRYCEQPAVFREVKM